MEYKACYQALQAHLRNQYGRDLADMKSAIERTTGNDPHKREQLGSKLQLLTTALHILNRNVTDASQDEYNALLHLGERIKSAVELYQAQKAKRTASRAAAAVGAPPACNHQQQPARGMQFPQLLPQLPAVLPPSDPSWELPLDFVSTIIADERKRLSPVPELTQLGPLQPPPPGALRLAGAPRMPTALARPPQTQQAGQGQGQQAADANPFMQQALAIAQGLPYMPGPAPHPINNSSINLPPLPGGGGSGVVLHHHRPAPGIGRTAISVDLGSSAARMAMASGFYSASFNADGSGKPLAHKRRVAAVLGEDELNGCEAGMLPSTSAGSAVAVGEGSMDGLRGSSLGNRAGGAAPTKYRSVSFDQARPLRPLRSCPDTELANCGLWRNEGPNSSGSFTPASQQLRCTVSMDPRYEGSAQPASPADRSCPQQPAAPAATAMTDTVSPFVHLAAQQQAAGDGAMPPPPHRPPQQQASLGGAGLTNSFAVASLNTSLPAGELGPALGSARLSSNPSLTGEALLQHRQRQWQQLLSLRQQQLALQEQEVAAQTASGAAVQASQQVPSQASQQDLSVSQMLLQGLGDVQHAQQQNAQLQAGGSPMEPSKRSKHDSSAPPTSNSTSGSGNSCTNGGSAAAAAAAARAQAAGASSSPAPLLGGATVGLPGSSSLTAATARLRLDPSTELGARPRQPASSQPQGWDPSASIEAFMMAAAAGGGAGVAAQQQQQQQQAQHAACFFGYNPAEQAQQAQQPLQGQPQLTSGLPGLSSEAINDFARQLQPSGPSLTGWVQQLVPTSPRGNPSPSNPHTPAQQLAAGGGAAPAAAAPPGGSSGGGFLAQMELGTLEDVGVGGDGAASGGSAFAAAAVQGAPLPADDAGGGEADMSQAPSLPSAFAGVDGPQGCFMEPGSSLFGASSLMDGAASLFGASLPLPSPSLGLGLGGGGGGGGMPNLPSLPMLNANSLLGGGAGIGGMPANAMDTARFDSLLLELGPDFLPDFEPQMSPQQAGR